MPPRPPVRAPRPVPSPPSPTAGASKPSAPLAASRPVAPVAPPGALAPREAKARLDAIVAELRTLKDHMAQMVYRVGGLMRELQDRQIVAAAECRTFEEVLEKYELGARVSAFKYMTVAETFDERDATRLGPERGYALARYAKLVGTPAPRLLADNARIGGKPLLELGPKAIGEAIRDLQIRRRAGAEAEDDTAEEADRAVRRLGSRLRAAGAPHASLRRVRRGSRWLVLVELDPDEALALASHVAK